MNDEMPEIGMKEVDLAAKLLAGACVQTNAETLKYSLTGFSIGGVPHGDWIITAKRKVAGKPRKVL